MSQILGRKEADRPSASSILKTERSKRVKLLLEEFGIKAQAKTLVGTHIREGISGGQKRRVSVAS